MRVLTLLTKGFAGAALMLAVPSTALAQGHVITQMFGKKSTACERNACQSASKRPRKIPWHSTEAIGFPKFTQGVRSLLCQKTEHQGQPDNEQRC